MKLSFLHQRITSIGMPKYMLADIISSILSKLCANVLFHSHRLTFVFSPQVQFSLLDRRPLNGMVQLCKAKGIKVLSYGSVGGGLLSDKYD